MKIVYLAGPYRADTAAEVERNIQNARRYHMALTEAGIFSFCPHVHMAHYDGLQEEQWFLDGTMEMMRRCDALVVMPGWEESDGTNREINKCPVNRELFAILDFDGLYDADYSKVMCIPWHRKDMGWWQPLSWLKERIESLPPRKDAK